MRKFSFKYIRVLIDLDNTLIEEKDYLFEAYNHIAKYLGSLHDINECELSRFMICTFEVEGRIDLFGKLQSHFNLPDLCLDEVLCIMRNVKLKQPLLMKTEAISLVRLLNQLNIPITIITNGNVDQQKNKIAQTDFMDLAFDFDIIFANEIRPKPAIDSFLAYCSRKSIDASFKEILMIGDSTIDLEFSRNLGCDFLHINEINIVDGQVYTNN